MKRLSIRDKAPLDGLGVVSVVLKGCVDDGVRSATFPARINRVTINDAQEDKKERFDSPQPFLKSPCPPSNR